MSRFCIVKTEFRDKEALIIALEEIGKWQPNQIEHHITAKHLKWYKNDTRPETAHIIIRREYVGRASNDIGFSQNEEGQYEAIISEFDSKKYGALWIGKLKGSYAFHKLRREQESHGRTVERTRCSRTGHQRVEITGYR